MSDNDPPILCEVVVYTLHRIGRSENAEEIEFEAMAQAGEIRLTDLATHQQVLVPGVLLTRREDHEVGMHAGSMFAITASDQPYPLYRRRDDGRFEVDKETFVKDVQMTIWSRR